MPPSTLLEELLNSLRKLAAGEGGQPADATQWYRLGGREDQLRGTLQDAVAHCLLDDPSPTLEACWDLLARPETRTQIRKAFDQTPGVDVIRLHRNACALLATEPVTLEKKLVDKGDHCVFEHDFGTMQEFSRFLEQCVLVVGWTEEAPNLA